MTRFLPLSVALVLLAAVGCTVGQAVPADARPSLNESLGWLKEKLATEGSFTDGVLTFGIEPMSFDGCSVTWKSSLGGVSGTTYSQESVYLSNLDPAKVTAEKQSENIYSVVLNATKDKTAVMERLYQRNGSLGTAVAAPHYVIYLRHDDMARRIVSAITHITKLCVAKPEPF